MTSDTPIACACSVPSLATSKTLPWESASIDANVRLRNSCANCLITVASHVPCSAALRAHLANTFHVSNTFSDSSSGNGNSTKGSKFWHVAGKNSQYPFSKARTNAMTKSRDCFISSSSEVRKPSNLDPVVMTQVSSPCITDGSSSEGRFANTCRVRINNGATYGLKSCSKLPAMRPAL